MKKKWRKILAAVICMTFLVTDSTIATLAAEVSDILQDDTTGNAESVLEQVSDISTDIQNYYTDSELQTEDEFGTKTLIVQLEDSAGDTIPSCKEPINSLNIGDGLLAVSFTSVEDTRAAYEELAVNSSVIFVEPDSIIESESENITDESNTEGSELSTEVMEPSTEPVEQLDDNTEVVTDTEAEPTEEAQIEDEDSIKVAVIDSGIDANNEYLKDYIQDSNLNLSASGSVASTQDDFGHGTGIAGIILNTTKDNHMMSGLKLIPIKVLDSNGKGTVLSMYLAIQAAIDMDVDIINLSLSTKTNSELIKQAVSEALNKDIMVVGAAGNTGADVKDYAPGNIEDVIVVGSVDANKEVCNYSNYGDTIDFVTYEQATTYGLNNTEQEMSGTSVSAAFMSGWAANLFSTSLNSTADDIYNYMISTAVDIGDTGKDIYYGYGLVGTMPENTEKEEVGNDKELEDLEEDIVSAAQENTYYPHSSGYFGLNIIAGNKYAQYRIYCSIGNRVPNSDSYYINYSMQFLYGTDLGITIAPDTYMTAYDNAPGYAPEVRQYHLPIRFHHNKTGYHFESASVDNCFQTYFNGMGDDYCDFIVDTNGCGMTNFGTDLQFHNDTIQVKYVANKYNVYFNGNGATSGSMNPLGNISYNNSFQIPANQFQKTYSINYNGNGGTATKTSESPNCAFQGWIDYNPFTVNGTTYQWWTMNAAYYAHKHPDLKAAYGYDKGLLVAHYDNYTVHGTEYRQSSEVFNMAWYLNYGGADLKAAFGSNKGAYSNHWNDYGYIEGRKGTDAIDTTVSNTYENGATISNLVSAHNVNAWLYAKWENPTIVLPNATRSGYQLLGWSTNSNATTANYAVGQKITVGANTSFYAVWKKAPGPTVVRITSVQNGTDGFYSYAYVKDNGTGINRTVFPIWTANNGQDDLAASWSSTQKGTKGSYIVDGVSYNYRFYTKASNHNLEYGLHNVHVYAYDNYEASDYGTSTFQYRFDVIYNSNGGSIEKDGSQVSTETKTYIYGSMYGDMPSPTRVGYSFEGWYTATEGGVQKHSSDTFTNVGTQTLYAQWKKNSFNVAYIGNEQTAGNDFVEYEKLQTEEYTFFNNTDDNTKHFTKDTVVSFTDSVTSELIEEDTTMTVVGWSFTKDNVQDTMFTFDSVINGVDFYNQAAEEGYITTNAPARDYNTYPEGAAGTETDKPENTPSDYINLYAVWDCGAVIEAYDIYLSLADAQAGNITEEMLLSYAQARDKEAVTNENPEGILNNGNDSENGTYFTVCDYAAEDFTGFLHDGSVTETYQAIDSAGNITRRKITVYIVNEEPDESTWAKAYTRFISEKYYNASYANGGLEENSLWKTDSEYVACIQDAFDNIRNNTPEETYSFTREEILQMQDFVDSHGIGNSIEDGALMEFYNQFLR